MKKKILVDFKILETRDNGGVIRVNTANFDRSRDRVFPVGAKIDN